ncbi:hypothetical protein JCM8097_005770 [Rhodosporidiobolus ruineniae]
MTSKWATGLGNTAPPPYDAPTHAPRLPPPPQPSSTAPQQELLNLLNTAGGSGRGTPRVGQGSVGVGTSGEREPEEERFEYQGIDKEEGKGEARSKSRTWSSGTEGSMRNTASPSPATERLLSSPEPHGQQHPRESVYSKHAPPGYKYRSSPETSPSSSPRLALRSLPHAPIATVRPALPSLSSSIGIVGGGSSTAPRPGSRVNPETRAFVQQRLEATKARTGTIPPAAEAGTRALDRSSWGLSSPSSSAGGETPRLPLPILHPHHPAPVAALSSATSSSGAPRTAVAAPAGAVGTSDAYRRARLERERDDLARQLDDAARERDLALEQQRAEQAQAAQAEKAIVDLQGEVASLRAAEERREEELEAARREGMARREKLDEAIAEIVRLEENEGTLEQEAGLAGRLQAEVLELEELRVEDAKRMAEVEMAREAAEEKVRDVETQLAVAREKTGKAVQALRSLQNERDRLVDALEAKEKELVEAKAALEAALAKEAEEGDAEKVRQELEKERAAGRANTKTFRTMYEKLKQDKDAEIAAVKARLPSYPSYTSSNPPPTSSSSSSDAPIISPSSSSIADPPANHPRHLSREFLLRLADSPLSWDSEKRPWPVPPAVSSKKPSNEYEDARTPAQRLTKTGVESALRKSRIHALESRLDVLTRERDHALHSGRDLERENDALRREVRTLEEELEGAYWIVEEMRAEREGGTGTFSPSNTANSSTSLLGVISLSSSASSSSASSSTAARPSICGDEDDAGSGAKTPVSPERERVGFLDGVGGTGGYVRSGESFERETSPARRGHGDES